MARLTLKYVVFVFYDVLMSCQHCYIEEKQKSVMKRYILCISKIGGISDLHTSIDVIPTGDTTMLGSSTSLSILTEGSPSIQIDVLLKALDSESLTV